MQTKSATKLSRHALITISGIILWSAIITPAFALSSEDRIQVTQSAGVNVRQSAGGTAYANGQSYGALGVITGSSQNAPINGTGTVYTWWYVDFDSGQDGWVATTGFSAVAPVAPTQVAPGNSSSPGLQISTLTLTISWNAALGANGYGVYVEDVGTSALVYNVDAVGNVTSVTLPSGTLVAGHNYVWNMRSSDSAGYTYCTTHYYFYTQAAAPTISSVSPNPATGSNSGQTLTINGSGFVSGAQVNLAWPTVGNIPAGNATLSATFVSSSQLQVSATLGNDPETWTAQVINPGSITSSTYNFAMQAPFPVITSLSPSSATAGGSAFTLTVNGTTFDQSSVIYWNGTALTTSHTVSSGLTTAISATVPASDIASAGSATVTVYTPSPGGGTSSGVTFGIGGGTPTITSVSPNPATGSNSGQTLTINGSGFVSGAQVNLAWPTVGNISAGNVTKSATFVSSLQLQVTATLGNDPETWTAQVINPGNVTSSTFNFSEQAPFPVITSLSPSSATAGGSSFTLTVNGTTFDQSSVIYWNGTALTTSHTISGGLTTAISATVPASDIASSGSATVTVYTPSPGGGTSSAMSFTIGSGGGGGSQILGIDVSTAINWPAATGIQFAYLKATESSSAYYPNPNFTANASGAIGQHIAVGAYHFATPLFSPNFYQAGYDHQDTAQDEALNFVATAQNVIGSGYLPPALDVEPQVVAWNASGTIPTMWVDPLSGVSCSGSTWDPTHHPLPSQPAMGAAALAQWIEDWVSDEEQLTHIAPIVYCDRTYATALSPYLNGTVQLWIADWTNPAGSPAAPAGWSWLFDQYSSTGSAAGKSPIDLDIFNGDSTAFNTLLNGTSGDTTPPTISITSPTTGSTYLTGSSTVSLSGTAGDNIGVVNVIWSDAQTGGAGSASGTTSWSVNNISLASGANTITVTAYDAAGNHSAATLTVTYTPSDTIPPTVSISSPTSGQAFTTSPVSVSGTATDPGTPSSGVSQVQVQVNSTSGTWLTASGTTSWSASASLNSGANTIYVRSQDGAGNYSTTASVNVTYNSSGGGGGGGGGDTTPPTLSITSPLNGATVTSASLPVSGTATDDGNGNDGISSVTVNGVAVNGDTASGIGIASWNTTIALYSGANIITVIATDGVGNTTQQQTSITYNPPRPVFGSLSLSGGQLQTILSGLSAQETVVFYVSTDLKNWTPVKTIVASGSTYIFTYPINPATQGQYFRASVQ